MHPSSLLSYYPTYSILDEVITSTSCGNLNIFIDLKNVLQTIYLEHAVLAILTTNEKSKFVDTSVFNSLISFLSFHKLYSAKRNKNINFYVFFETGESLYHKNISKTYKMSRKTDNLYGLEKDKRDKFFEILQKNYRLIESACNKMPNIKVIRLQNLEADFIPYYLIRNKMVDIDNSISLIYSNDHDMLQILDLNENIYIFSKSGKGKKLIKRKEVMSNFLKTECSFPDSYFPFCMAILGDMGDDVRGIKGIGPKRIVDVLEDLIQLGGGIEKIYNNVFNNLPIFEKNSNTYENKYMSMIVDDEINNKTISNNLKLVSFELISRMMDDPSKTEFIQRRKQINQVLLSNDISPIQSMKNALQMNGVFVLEEELKNIYFQMKDNINEVVKNV